MKAEHAEARFGDLGAFENPGHVGRRSGRTAADRRVRVRGARKPRATPSQIADHEQPDPHRAIPCASRADRPWRNRPPGARGRLPRRYNGHPWPMRGTVAYLSLPRAMLAMPGCTTKSTALLGGSAQVSGEYVGTAQDSVAGVQTVATTLAQHGSRGRRHADAPRLPGVQQRRRSRGP